MIQLLLALIFTTPAQAHFAKDNNMYIPDDKTLVKSGISKEQFDSAINKVEDTYTQVAKNFGYTLEIVRSWDDGTVNSSTITLDKKWIINAYGGLARYPGMTVDAYLLVLCHELGHHMGGYPKVNGSDWASNEGQSDYFAVMKGFRKLTRLDVAPQILVKQCEDDVYSKCCKNFSDYNEISVCKRSIAAGLVLATILQELDESPAISLQAKDKNEVDETNDDHPAAQCRLDTYYSGSICTVSYKKPFSRTNPSTGACSEENGDKEGFRPKCWYKPLK